MSRSFSTCKPPHRPFRAQIQPLEPRTLLAVGFDPTFGGGDGFALLTAPFSQTGTSGGQPVTSTLVPRILSRLTGGYFTVGVHSVLQEDQTVINARNFHALVEDDGAISTDLARDTNGDGLVFYNTEEFGTGTFVGPGQYLDLAPLEDGSTLALLAAAPGADTTVVRVLPDGKESQFFSIDGIGNIHAIELLTPETGVLLVTITAPGAQLPIDPEEQIYALRTFNALSGELSDAVLPFGDWLRLDRVSLQPTLHVGRDGAVYVGTLTQDLDGPDPDLEDGGFILARLKLVAGELAIDETFGTEDLPGQETPAFYQPTPNVPLANAQSFLLAGVTDVGRAWIKMPLAGSEGLHFALLTSEGALDPAFGTDGIVTVDFPAALQLGETFADQTVSFPGARGGLTGAPAPFVRGDGSLVGLVSLEDGAILPGGTEFAVGVYSILADGSLDPRIAEAGSVHGVGRAIAATGIDLNSAVESSPVQAVAFLDESERLVISAEVVSDATPAGTLQLMVSRVLLGTPKTDTLTRINGDRVFKVVGTGGDDRYVLRPTGGGGGLLLFQDPIGAPQSLIGQFSSAGLDLIEISGGEGQDVLFSELQNFSGFVTIFGGNGNDVLSASGRFDRVFGDGGNDSLLGGQNDQLIFGGAGNDTFNGGAGRDALFGEDGNDVLVGQSGGDFLSGGAGNDLLEGSEDDDTVDGGLGDDTLRGGDGIDLVSYADYIVSVTASLFAGSGGAAGESDVIAGDLERLLGGSGSDLLTGHNGLNFLVGGGGADTLQGLGGRDTLLGGDGADLLDGGLGDDLLIDFDALLLGGGPDHFTGASGNDLALVDVEDEVDEDVEGAFSTLEELLAAIDARDA